MATVGNNAFVFDPTQISGCRLWLDASDPTTITYSSGTSVSQWRDKSGYRNHVSQSTASNQPTISSNYVNGRSAMLFTPNQWVQGSISIDSYTRFLVYSNSVVNVGAAVMDGAGFLQNGGGTTYQDMVGYFTPPPSFQTGSFFRIAEAYFPVTGGTSGRIWIDATEFTSLPYYAPTGNYPSTYVAFGRRGDGIYFTGAIAEAILFNRQLTTSEMNMMEGYLAYKYGLQSRIPSNHPYKTAIVRTLLPNQAFTTIIPSFSDWRPTQISGCQLWFDAADVNGNGTTISAGTSVTNWRDKSGNGRNASSVVGTPVMSNNSIISRVGVFFNGSSYLTGSFSYTFNTLSWFVVGTMDSDGDAYGRLLSFGDASQYDFDSTLRLNALARFNLTNEIGTYRNAYIGSNMFISYSSPFMYSSVLDGTNNTPYLNGTQGTGAATSGNFGFNTFGLSASFGLNVQRNKGFLFEVIVFSRALTTAQRQQIEGYLAWKWGLQVNLPPSHPYKMQVPIKSGIAINSLTTMTQGLWTPTRVSGLQLWLDAADPNGTGVTPANGSTISTWKDKSSNGFSGTAINSPTVQINALNKLPVVRFNGTNQYINFGNVLNLGTNPLTIFVITKFDTTNESGIIGKTAYAAANMRWALWYGKSGLGSSVTGVQNIHQDDAQTGSSLVSTNPVTIGTQYNLYTYVTSRNTFLLNLNGSLAGSVSNTGTPSNFSTSYNLYVGAYADSTGSTPRTTMYLNGDIAEILVYFTNLSVSQYQQVEGYLAWKWGLQSSLPSTHPFVKWPPPP